MEDAAKYIERVNIPNSLRTIGPFLEEAQSLLRQKEKGNKKVTVVCIDHALKLVKQFGLSIDDEAESILKLFREKRDEIAVELEIPVLDDESFAVFRSSAAAAKEVSAEDILIAEGTATLELADKQAEEGMHQAAARNYHTATVYFRVLESMVPRLTSRVHDSLNYAACRTQQSSHLLENLVHEHFEGLRCVDFYEIIENKRLGKGSYGSVYLCKHRKTGDEFACKVIGMSRINSHYLRKLHLEISIMKEVDHPNIIKLREVFFGSRTVYLVMELCKGGELFDEITHNAQRGLSEAHAAKLMCDILSAVRYLHEQGIAHRDLKLENFLFEQPGMHSPLKLIDFGLSKHFDENESMHQVVGSAYYTAPEVLGGSYDYRCDVWSVGVIAYMLLSGAPPFNGDSSEKIHHLILHKEPDYSAKMFPKALDTTIEFLKGLLNKDPTKRMSIEEAFAHPFLKQASTDAGSPKAEASLEVMSSLGRFMRLSRFKKLMLEAVAFSLTPAQISILRTEFNAIDTDRSGTISLVELQEYVAKVSTENVTAATRALESYSDDTTTINYIDFLAAAMCKRIAIDDERLVLAFETLDVESKGYLDADAIRRAMGAGISDVEVAEMIAEVDEQSTGKIHYDDFVKFWRTFIQAQKISPLQRFIQAVRKVSNRDAALRIMRGNRSREAASPAVSPTRLYGMGISPTVDEHKASAVIAAAAPDTLSPENMEIQHNRMLSVDQSVQVNSNVSDAERFALESKSRSVSIKLLNVADDDEEDDTSLPTGCFSPGTFSGVTTPTETLSPRPPNESPKRSHAYARQAPPQAPPVAERVKSDSLSSERDCKDNQTIAVAVAAAIKAMDTEALDGKESSARPATATITHSYVPSTIPTFVPPTAPSAIPTSVPPLKMQDLSRRAP